MDTWLTVTIALVAAVGSLASLVVAISGRRAQAAEANKLTAEAGQISRDSTVSSWKMFADAIKNELARANLKLEVARGRVCNLETESDELREEHSAAIAHNQALQARLAECEGQDLVNAKS